jgi:hypothetical protein
MPVTQLDKGNAFRALHQGPRAFIIANAWDAGSARVLAGLGFGAIATSSGASAGVYGKRDGAITREQALAHARAIADATDLPVSADLESGFGAAPAEVAETYRQAAAAGLVGATLEDATPEQPMDFSEVHHHQEVRDVVSKICAKYNDDYWRMEDKEGTFPHDFYRAMADGNWIGCRSRAIWRNRTWNFRCDSNDADHRRMMALQIAV